MIDKVWSSSLRIGLDVTSLKSEHFVNVEMEIGWIV
jgi:hypothetical protein